MTWTSSAPAPAAPADAPAPTNPNVGYSTFDQRPASPWTQGDASSWRFPNGMPAPAPAPKADSPSTPGQHGAALASSATAMADRLLAGGDAGGDLASLLAEAKKALGQTPGAALAEAAFEPDPDAGKPSGVTLDAFAIAIGRAAPEAVRAVGGAVVADASKAVAEMPRELVGLLDAEGAFAKPLTLQLLGQLHRNAAAADPKAADRFDPTPEKVAAFAREHGLPADFEHIDGAVRLLASLPPRIKAGLSDAMLRDPQVWDLARHLGGKLFAHEPRRRRR